MSLISPETPIKDAKEPTLLGKYTKGSFSEKSSFEDNSYNENESSFGAGTDSKPLRESKEDKYPVKFNDEQKYGKKYDWVDSVERSATERSSIKEFLTLQNIYQEIRQELKNLCHDALGIFRGEKIPSARIITKLVLLPEEFKLPDKISRYTFDSKESQKRRIDGLYLAKIDSEKKLGDVKKISQEPEETKVFSPSLLKITVSSTSKEVSENRTPESKISSKDTSNPPSETSDLSRETVSDLKSTSIITQSSTDDQKAFLTQMLVTINQREHITSLNEIIFLKMIHSEVYCFYYDPVKSFEEVPPKIQFYQNNQKIFHLHELQTNLPVFPEQGSEPIAILADDSNVDLFDFIKSKFSIKKTAHAAFPLRVQQCFNRLQSFKESVNHLESSKFSEKIKVCEDILTFIFTQYDKKLSTPPDRSRMISSLTALCNKLGFRLEAYRHKDDSPATLPEAYILLNATTKIAFLELYRDYVQFASIDQQLDVLQTYRLQLNKNISRFKELSPEPLAEEDWNTYVHIRRQDCYQLEDLVTRKLTVLTAIKTHFNDIEIPYVFFVNLVLHAGNGHLEKFAEAYDDALLNREQEHLWNPERATHLLTLLKVMTALKDKISDPTFQAFFSSKSSPQSNQSLLIFISIKIKELRILLDSLRALPLRISDLTQLFEEKPLTSITNSCLLKIVADHRSLNRSLPYLAIHRLVSAALSRSNLDFQRSYEDFKSSHHSPKNIQRVLMLAYEFLNQTLPLIAHLPIATQRKQLQTRHVEISTFIYQEISNLSKDLHLNFKRRVDEWHDNDKDSTPGLPHNFDTLSDKEKIKALQTFYDALNLPCRNSSAMKELVFSFLLDWHNNLLFLEKKNSVTPKEKKSTQTSLTALLAGKIHEIHLDIATDPWFAMRDKIIEKSTVFGRNHAQLVAALQNPKPLSADFFDPEINWKSLEPMAFRIHHSVTADLLKATLFLDLVNFEIYFKVHFSRAYRAKQNETYLNELHRMLNYLTQRVNFVSLQVNCYGEKTKQSKLKLGSHLNQLKAKLNVNKTSEEMFNFLQSKAAQPSSSMPLNENADIIMGFLRYREEVHIHHYQHQTLLRMRDSLRKMQVLTAFTLAKSLKANASNHQKILRAHENSKKTFWTSLKEFLFDNEAEDHASVFESSYVGSRSESLPTKRGTDEDLKETTHNFETAKKNFDSIKKSSAELTETMREDLTSRIEELQKNVKSTEGELKIRDRILSNRKPIDTLSKNIASQLASPSTLDEKLLSHRQKQLEENFQPVEEGDRIRTSLQEKINNHQLQITQLKSTLSICNDLALVICNSKDRFFEKDKKNKSTDSLEIAEKLSDQLKLNRMFGMT